VVSLWEVVVREVTEGRVLGFGEQLVISEFPGFAVSLGEDLLEVVLDDHRASVVDLGHAHLSDVTHTCLIRYFLNKL